MRQKSEAKLGKYFICKTVGKNQQTKIYYNFASVLPHFFQKWLKHYYLI